MDWNTGASADVLVIGAGPAGAATAMLLAEAGASVTLVDRAVFPRAKACSEFMSPEAARVLARLGVLDVLERSGAVPLDGITVHAPFGGRLRGIFARAEVAPWRRTGLAVARQRLDAELVEAARARGVRVLERLTLVDLLHDCGAVAGGVFREVSGALRTIRARVTIGADGLHSRVARRIGRRRHGPLKRLAVVAHMRDVRAGDSGQADLFVGRRGYVGLNPVGGGLTNVAAVVPLADAYTVRGRKAGFLRDECRKYPDVWARVAEARLAGSVHAVGPFDVWASQVTADGAALVGDAADFLDPFTGDGIVSALRGAEMLAATLAVALDSEKSISRRAMEPYRTARRRAFRGKRAVARLVATTMQSPRLFDRAVRRLERHALAHTLIGVTGEFVPARAVLNPRVLARLVF